MLAVRLAAVCLLPSRTLAPLAPGPLLWLLPLPVLLLAPCLDPGLEGKLLDHCRSGNRSEIQHSNQAEANAAARLTLLVEDVHAGSVTSRAVGSRGTDDDYAAFRLCRLESSNSTRGCRLFHAAFARSLRACLGSRGSSRRCLEHPLTSPDPCIRH